MQHPPASRKRAAPGAQPVALIVRHEGAMADSQWKQAYEEMLDEAEARGEVEELARDRERREEPRFRLRSRRVFMRVQLHFDVVDVSVAGISVYSDIPFKVNQPVIITLGKAFSVEATVVDCPLVEADPNLLETKYLVRCQFASEAVGMQFLVMMKQMDDLELNPGAALNGNSG
jgi:hypothetical protein